MIFEGMTPKEKCDKAADALTDILESHDWHDKAVLTQFAVLARFIGMAESHMTRLEALEKARAKG